MFFSLSHISSCSSHKVNYFTFFKSMCQLHALCSILYKFLHLKPCDHDISCTFVTNSRLQCYPYCYLLASPLGLSSPHFLLSFLIPISSCSPLYAIHSHSSQIHLFSHGVTSWSCHFISLSPFSLPLPVFRNVDTSKSKTSAPLPQKVLSYSFLFNYCIISVALI